jgi:hypothetical protein
MHGLFVRCTSEKCEKRRQRTCFGLHQGDKAHGYEVVLLRWAGVPIALKLKERSRSVEKLCYWQLKELFGVIFVNTNANFFLDLITIFSMTHRKFFCFWIWKMQEKLSMTQAILIDECPVYSGRDFRKLFIYPWSVKNSESKNSIFH